MGDHVSIVPPDFIIIRKGSPGPHNTKKIITLECGKIIKQHNGRRGKTSSTLLISRRIIRK
jgi:hypothetical protein